MIKLPKNKFFNTAKKMLFSSLSPVSDEIYIAIYYYLSRGRSLRNLYQPQMLGDKINWLKLNYRNPKLKILVDKYAVREYVKDKIGASYLNELYFKGEAITKETYKNLPQNFVLKATHGSSMNLLIQDKREIDYETVNEISKKWLSTDYYKTRREWAYKGVPHNLVCEKYLVNKNGKVPEDYKIFCFHGEPILIQVDIDRFCGHARNLYDLEWNKLPIKYNHPNYSDEISKPKNISEMIDITRKLAEHLPFARIDLYSIDHVKIIFGEITIYPGSGSAFMQPIENEYKYGKLLDLRFIEKNKMEKIDGSYKVQTSRC